MNLDGARLDELERMASGDTVAPPLVIEGREYHGPEVIVLEPAEVLAFVAGVREGQRATEALGVIEASLSQGLDRGLHPTDEEWVRRAKGCLAFLRHPRVRPVRNLDAWEQQ